MKNIGLCLGLFAFFALASCEKKEKIVETVETNTVTTETDTVIVRDEAPKEDGTSVKINSNGVDVDSKDGHVEIKK